MDTTTIAPINDADNILTAFAHDLETGTVSSVADWTTRYPELGRDFVRIAASHFAGAPDAPAEGDRLEQAALNALRKHRASYLGSSALITSLVDKERGITAKSLSDALRLPLSFIAKLNQRLFQAATIPQTLVERLADATRRTVDEVTAFLSAPPMLAHGAAYRADDAPVVGQAEDFAAALASDADVSPEARALYGRD